MSDRLLTCVGRPSNGQAISLPDGFKFTDVDSRHGKDYRNKLAPAKQAGPPLGILATLAGKCFRGQGIKSSQVGHNPPPCDGSADEHDLT